MEPLRARFGAVGRGGEHRPRSRPTARVPARIVQTTPGAIAHDSSTRRPACSVSDGVDVGSRQNERLVLWQKAARLAPDRGGFRADPEPARRAPSPIPSGGRRSRPRRRGVRGRRGGRRSDHARRAMGDDRADAADGAHVRGARRRRRPAVRARRDRRRRGAGRRAGSACRRRCSRICSSAWRAT